MSHRRTSLLRSVKAVAPWLALGPWLAVGCSAIVSPDLSRLAGGGDASLDGGVIGSPDAFVAMGCAGGCDDGVACTRDMCVAEVCRSAPDDTLCAPEQRCVPSGCVPRMGCGDPTACDDGNACTTDECAMGVCANRPGDDDLDGHGDAACGGDDCDDTMSAVHPGVPEVCGNGLDDDCNPGTPDACTTRVPDDCGSAQLVDLSSGSAVVRGDFSELSAHYPTFCAGGGGARTDAVYRIELGARPVDLRIETVGALDTVLSVSAECGSFSLPACNDDQRPGADTNARVWVHPAVGTLYVLVSALDVTRGPYEVRFTTSPVAPNECGSGSLDITPGGTAIGISVPPSRVTGTCMGDGTGGLSEAAFHFDGGRIDRLRAYTGYTGYLHVRSSCDLADEERCVEGTPIGGGATVTETNVRTGASRLHVFLDGASSIDQVYALFVEP